MLPNSTSLLPVIAVSLVCFGSLSCSPPPAGLTVNITGPPNEIVDVQVAPLQPLCCSGSQGCVSTQSVTLDQNGFGRVTRLVNPGTVTLLGRNTGCQGFAAHLPPAPCPPVASLQATCIVILSSAPTGKIDIGGPGVECIMVNGRYMCNNTRVYMTINGTTVSTLAVYGYTAGDVATNLTNAINSNPNLSPIVTASKTGNAVRVTSRTTGIEYSYPWYTRCTFNQLAGFSERAFSATLGPAATLHPDAP